MIKVTFFEEISWIFEYGLVKAKVYDGLSKNGDGLILIYLAKIKTLAENPPAKDKTYLVNRVLKLAQFAGKDDLIKI